MSGRVPTEKQYVLLRALGSGAVLVCGSKRKIEPLLRREWVKGEHRPGERYPYAFVQITPAGLRALADGAEKYGWPDVPKKREARS